MGTFNIWDYMQEEMKNVELDKKDIEIEDQVHESIEEVQADASAYFLGRY